MKIHKHYAGHTTKMEITLSKSSFQEPVGHLDETWYEASGIQPIIFCSNDNPGLTLTYFTARSNFATYAFL